MARPLPNEDALYQRILEEKILVPDSVWDEMYSYLGDYISVINLILSYYIDRREAVAVADARKILDYTRLIKEVVRRILGGGESATPRLHPIVRDLFTHYVGNDIHIINLCVSYYLDPLDERPVALEDAQKILPCTLSVRGFLDRLRTATIKMKGEGG